MPAKFVAMYAAYDPNRVIGGGARPNPLPAVMRLLIFAESYGLSSADGLVDRVIAVQSDMRALVARLADEGFPRQVEQVTTGYLEELQARIGWSLQHRFLIDP